MVDLSPVKVVRLDRDLAVEQVEDLVALNASSEWDDWTAVHLLADRPEKWARSLLAVGAAGGPVGYAIASRPAQAVHLHHLVVHPAHRGSGVGAALVARLIDESTDVGRLTLKVHPTNHAAIRFYIRHGFAEMGHSAGGYLEMSKDVGTERAVTDMRVAIHQPNYAPWCGYFAKMLVCDAFVFFDDAQLPQGRSYVSRTKVSKGGNGEQWLTVPIRRGGLRRINEVEFAEEGWNRKQLSTLRHEYAKAPFVREIFDLLAPCFEDPGHRLAPFNQRFIETVARYLGWQGEFHLSSNHPSSLLADERLAQLTEAVKGTAYVSGAGGQNYQSEQTFSARGQRLEVRTYRPLPYERGRHAFVPGLSIFDALCYLGRRARDVCAYGTSEPVAALIEGHPGGRNV